MSRKTTTKYDVPERLMDIVKKQIASRDDKIEEYCKSSNDLEAREREQELERLCNKEARISVVNIVAEALKIKPYALSPQLIFAVNQAEKNSPYSAKSRRANIYRYLEPTAGFLQSSRNGLFQSQGIKSMGIKQAVYEIRKRQDEDVGILGGDRGLVYFLDKKRMVQSLRKDLSPVKVIYKIKGLTI
ncbi:MAG: hypothetical protein AABW79_02740 [Nanoarchaeota archaeon]